MADVTLSLNGTMIKGVEETEDMYSSIDQVMDKIEKQVKRYREKLRKRRSESRKSEEKLGMAEPEDISDLVQEEPTIEIEKLVAKPMDAEEAAMQLNMSQQDFFVFRNSRSREINVMYKRKDGNLSVIEPSS
jgi:putative sigma-54 modulation protein